MNDGVSAAKLYRLKSNLKLLDADMDMDNYVQLGTQWEITGIQGIQRDN
jgi:hypothetical protein